MGIDGKRLRRAVAGLAAAGLATLITACGSGDDRADAPAAAAPTAAVAAPKGDGAGADKGMRDGCDAVHKMFAALDSGDTAAAERFKDTGKSTFDGVVAGTKDPQLASNATAMSDMLGFGLPDKPIHDSTLAETYAVDCVSIYGAAALTGAS